MGPTDLGAPSERALADFTMSPAALRLVPLALAIGALATVVAVGLLDLIGLVTNAVYAGRLDVALQPPDPGRLGLLSIAVPVVGGLVIGVMARFGSERIRGHGIPEAMETILVGGSRVEPRLAVLKPVSSAISIGSGGPFGAEGPIILTGGALGSILGQLFHLSAAERRTLLVSGAAAGMTAVFATPVAAVLLAAELLLFEWRPRSLIPVAAACALAASLRIELSGAGYLAAAPLFPVAEHPILGGGALVGSLVVGACGGLLAWLMTGAVYGAEDAFSRLPIHWMWWPALGGLVVGVGGLIEPRALGVGYASIRAELGGDLAIGALVSLLIVKLVVWSVALGSGTSGGILAPILIIGGAAGGILGQWLPGALPATWAILGMSAALAGVTRSPLTSMIFAVELTHDQNILLPLLVACMSAHAISVLALRRSILTEKVARRGVHVMREYAVDPLEALVVRDVMATDVVTTGPERPLMDLARHANAGPRQRQKLYPVISPTGLLVGVVARRDVAQAIVAADPAERQRAVSSVMRPPVVGYTDETLRHVADRMASTGLGAFPVVDREKPDRLCGLVSQLDLLRARERLLIEERHRERVLRPRFVPSGRLLRGSD